MRFTRGPRCTPRIPWGSRHLLRTFGHIQQSHLLHFGFRSLQSLLGDLEFPVDFCPFRMPLLLPFAFKGLSLCFPGFLAGGPF